MSIDTISSPIGDLTRLDTASKANKAETRPPLSEKKQAAVSDQSTRTDSNTKANVDDSEKTEPQQVGQAVADVNSFFQNVQRKLSFSVNDALGSVVIEVKNSETEEVIRQIPPEAVVKLAERLSELDTKDDEVVGFFLKEQA